MEINKELFPEKIAGGATPDAWLDDGHLCATNGRAAVMLPVEGGPDGLDPIIRITTTHLQTIRKAGGSVEITADAFHLRPPYGTLPRCDDVGYRPPPVAQVIPGPGSGEIRIGLDPALLLKLAQAMGAGYVELEIGDDCTPIRVTPICGKLRSKKNDPAPVPGAVGAIMPVSAETAKKDSSRRR